MSKKRSGPKCVAYMRGQVERVLVPSLRGGPVIGKHSDAVRAIVRAALREETK